MDTNTNRKSNRGLTQINPDRFFESGMPGFTMPNLRTSVFIFGSPLPGVYSRQFVSIRSPFCGYSKSPPLNLL